MNAAHAPIPARLSCGVLLVCPAGSAPIDDGGRAVTWRPFAPDHRGAVATGAVTEFRRERRVAYFHTALMRDGDGEAELVAATVDGLAIWVNGAFIGFGPAQASAWWDAAWNVARPRVRARVQLREGCNDVLIRVVGGVYASGGFYLAVAEPAR